MSTIVRLNELEMYLCAQIAAMRMTRNMRDGRRERYGAAGTEGPFERHLFGCYGEMAVAKRFNLFWAGTFGDFDAVDVGGKVQVRATARPDRRLILHDDDDDAHPFVLALAHDLPNIVLRGWLFARDGKRKEFWDDPQGGRPAFFVPQSALLDIAQLGAAIGGLAE